MGSTPNGSSALRRFERGNALEIRNGIMFDFYQGLPHMHIQGCYGNHFETYMHKPRLHVAFKPVPKPVSIELAWKLQV